MPPRWTQLAAIAAVFLTVVMWTTRDAWSARGLPVAAPIVVNTAFVERYDTLHRNETLSHLFARHNITGAELIAVLDVADGLDPRRIRAGQTFEFRYAVGDDRPGGVRVRLGDDHVLRLVRDSSAWRFEKIAIVWTVHRESMAAEIDASLYETVHAVIPDSVLPRLQREQFVWDLADGVYGWVIDFTRDIYPGDRLSVVYERLTSQLGDVRFGRVLAANVSSRGHEMPAYLLPGDGGRNAYYDEDGQSLRRAFRMYPVQYRYISSSFSLSRVHPILRVRRPHLGVDYRAASGTPVRATADGTVVRAERWGGYGIMVAIRHAKGIETRYAHLQSVERGIRPGVRVVQDQMIGRVGMTGLATAPHVHYEFIQGGRHVNPRTVSFGTADPVPEDRRAEFAAVRAHYDRLLAGIPAQPVHTARVDD